MPIDKLSGIISSKEKDIIIPDGFVHDLILNQVLKDFDPNRPFETEFATDKTSTYGWLVDTYRRVATWLHKRGITQGDRVAFYSKSFIEYIPCVLAIWRVGATCTYIRPEMIADMEFRKAVGIPKIVFVSKDRLSQLVEAGYDSLVVYRSKPEELPAGIHSFDEVFNENPEELNDFKIDGDPSKVLAIVSFTGGTTGNPKPIQLSHRNLISVLAFELNGVALTYGEGLKKLVHICPFPTVHLTGILYRVTPLLVNGHSILFDPPARAEDICEAIQKYRANAMTATPVTLISMLRLPNFRKYDLSSWEMCVVVGGPLMGYMKDNFCQQLSLRDIYLRLGMSECCGCVMISSNLPGSVGHVAPNTEVKVVSIEDGSVITEPGTVGEFCVRGPQVMIGYYNLPEKNKLAFDDDKFFHTGDLVTFDKDLNFYYFDRVQEFIRHPSGQMISATELELIIAYQNATVSEVSVIQSSDGPRAIVVPVSWPEDEEALRKDIVTRTNSVIDESWKHLSGGVAFLKAEEVPRTVLGKHLKRQMKHL